MNTQTQELLEAVFYVGTVSMLYIGAQNQRQKSSELEVSASYEIASGSQWWPDAARSHRPKVMPMRKYETVGSC
jgi:hypothetical protein